MPINYKRCLKCHANRGVRIVFGEPTSEAVEQANARKLVIGGCMIEIDGPEYECFNCHHRWNRMEAIEAAYNDLKAIHFTVGGFHQGHHEFSIDFERGEVSYEHRLSMDAPVVKRVENVVCEKRWLEQIDLLNWKRSYDNREILDGEQWSMEIRRNGRTLYKSGSNTYPKQWQAFCEWLENLVGQTIFDFK